MLFNNALMLVLDHILLLLPNGINQLVLNISVFLLPFFFFFLTVSLKGSRCWNRRNCFYSFLPVIQIIYSEANS